MGLLWRLWLPLTDRLTSAMSREGRRVQGIRGPVGCGKSTLASMLALLLSGRGVRVLRLSLDDLYLPPEAGGAERGPPGSHDVALGVEVLDAVHRGDAEVRVPRFDKGAREGRGARVGFEAVGAPDVALFEGWFVGNLPAVPDPGQPAALAGHRALEVYRPLWKRVNALWALRAPSVADIRRWRHEAEESARRRGKGLPEAEVDALLDRMLGALPPERYGAVTPSGGDAGAAASSPEPEVVVDLDSHRRPVAAGGGT